MGFFFAMFSLNDACDRAYDNIVLRGTYYFQKRERSVKPIKIKTIKKGYRVTVTALSLAIGFLMTAVLGTQARLPDTVFLYGDQALPFSQLDGVRITGDTAALSAGNTQVELSLWGAVPIKTVSVSKSQNKTVLLSGEAVGVKAYTDGLIVVGLSQVTTAQGSVNPAKDAGLKEGDIIRQINGENAKRVTDFSAMIRQGKTLKLKVQRNQKQFSVTLQPVISKDEGCYRLGLWLRDSCAGIGTMTYYDPQSEKFAMLGHGIYDCDTGILMTISRGSVYDVDITHVTRGSRGSAGELTGVFQDTCLGTVSKNLDCGVYGSCAKKLTGIPVEVASRMQVQCGSAQILCTVNGEAPQYYQCEIVRLNKSIDNGEKGLIVRITDQRLLDVTGGIVQGMSGSPIVQNGKFVGAVTHVFLNDPTRGYGIFAENMLEMSQSVAGEQLKEAS